MPAGVLVTTPEPDVVTVSGYEITLKLAVTTTFVLVAIVHGPVPAHPPPVHPSNVEPGAGVAVTVKSVPSVNVAAHALPQLMAAGVLVTVPLPVPVLLTETRNPELPPAVAHASAEYGEAPSASQANAR